MTIEEKVTQIIMPSIRYKTYEKLIEKDEVGNEKEVLNTENLYELNQ